MTLPVWKGREYQSELYGKISDQRFSLRRHCSCERDGWGCCCAQPIRASVDDEGLFMLVLAPEKTIYAGLAPLMEDE